MSKAILISVLIINFGSYFWSVFGVFRKHEEQKKLDYRILQLASIATWIICIWDVQNADLSAWTIWLATFAEALFGLFYWIAARHARQGRLTIAFSMDAPEIILQSGPYNFVRHPCYTAYLGSYLIPGLITLAPGSLLMFILMVAIYIKASATEEQKFANGNLASEYEAYRSKTGRFFPRIF